MSEKTEVEISYVVYVVENGLLVEPKKSGYTHCENVFNTYGYDTMEEALSEINRIGGFCQYIVLPIISKRIVF